MICDKDVYGLKATYFEEKLFFIVPGCALYGLQFLLTLLLLTPLLGNVQPVNEMVVGHEEAVLGGRHLLDVLGLYKKR